MMRPTLAFLTGLALAGAVCAGEPAPNRSEVDLGMQLERERQLLKQLQERLVKAESRTGDALEGYRRLRLKGGFTPAALDQVPATVVSEGLRVERTSTERDLLYKVTATNVPVIQVFEAVAKTSGLPLELHADAGRARLLGRVFVDMQGVDLPELLEVVAGTQSLGVQVGETSILVAPLTALSHDPMEKHLSRLAVEAHQNALMRSPGSPSAPLAYLGIARYYAGAGYHDAAVQSLQNIVERYPQSEARGAAFLLLGDCYAATQRGDNARGAYYRYIDNYPGASDLTEVLMKIGATWTAEGKWGQAMPVFEAVVREYPKSPQVPYARMRMAECLSQLDQYELAVSHLRAIEGMTQKFTHRDELNLVLAECLVKLKQYGNARVCLRNVVLRSPNAALAEKACYALGDTFLAEGNSLAALEAYEAGRHTFPRGALRTAAPLRLSRVYLQMGLYNQAEKELAFLLEAKSSGGPDFRALVLGLYQYWLDTGQANRVLTHAGGLASLASALFWPTDFELDPEVLRLRALAFQALGQSGPALESAARLSRLAKDDALRGEAFRIIGDCLTLRKEPLRAAMAYGGKTE